MLVLLAPMLALPAVHKICSVCSGSTCSHKLLRCRRQHNSTNQHTIENQSVHVAWIWVLESSMCSTATNPKGRMLESHPVCHTSTTRTSILLI